MLSRNQNHMKLQMKQMKSTKNLKARKTFRKDERSHPIMIYSDWIASMLEKIEFSNERFFYSEYAHNSVNACENELLLEKYLQKRN